MALTKTTGQVVAVGDVGVSLAPVFSFVIDGTDFVIRATNTTPDPDVVVEIATISLTTLFDSLDLTVSGIGAARVLNITSNGSTVGSVPLTDMYTNLGDIGN